MTKQSLGSEWQHGLPEDDLTQKMANLLLLGYLQGGNVIGALGHYEKDVCRTLRDAIHQIESQRRRTEWAESRCESLRKQIEVAEAAIQVAEEVQCEWHTRGDNGCESRLISKQNDALHDYRLAYPKPEPEGDDDE